MDATERADELRRALRDASAEELEALLDEHLAALDAPAVRNLFRNPFLTREQIERVLDVPELVSAYEVRLEAARHPRTPQLRALAFVPGLFWPDLVRIGVDTHLHPVVRRAADQRLVERLPGMAIGEKVALARKGSPTLVAALRLDPTPRVIEALLENPRLTEGSLLPLVASEGASPRTLAVVASSARWSVRYPVRVALCRNPRTPPDAVLSHLPMLKKHDLAAVASDMRLTLPVRRRAELLARGPRNPGDPRDRGGAPGRGGERSG